jgi:hypothetical protein
VVVMMMMMDDDDDGYEGFVTVALTENYIPGQFSVFLVRQYYAYGDCAELPRTALGVRLGETAAGKYKFLCYIHGFQSRPTYFPITPSA